MLDKDYFVQFVFPGKLVLPLHPASVVPPLLFYLGERLYQERKNDMCFVLGAVTIFQSCIFLNGLIAVIFWNFSLLSHEDHHADHYKNVRMGGSCVGVGGRGEALKSRKWDWVNSNARKWTECWQKSPYKYFWKIKKI